MVIDRDLRIFRELRRNARQSLTGISEKTGIPISTINDVLKKNKNSIIKNHISLFDYSRLGYSIRAKILLKLDAAGKEKEFEQVVQEHKNINSAFRLDNSCDFIIDFICSNMSELQDFMNKANNIGVVQKQVFFITENLKEEGFRF